MHAVHYARAPSKNQLSEYENRLTAIFLLTGNLTGFLKPSTSTIKDFEHLST